VGSPKTLLNAAVGLSANIGLYEIVSDLKRPPYTLNEFNLNRRLERSFKKGGVGTNYTDRRVARKYAFWLGIGVV
jgi:hypothetical protein